MPHHPLSALVVGVCLFFGPSIAAAQPLGAFYWQLAPYCNVVALHITQHLTPPGAVYAVTGFDDQCGALERATVVGTATFNHDGTVGVGLTIVVVPGGTPIHLAARMTMASMSGPWTDSTGNAGSFVPLGPARAERLRDRTQIAAGSPRPVPLGGIAPGSITAAQLAPGSIGVGQIDASQIQARVIGDCPAGQYLRGVNADGSVACASLPPLPAPPALPTAVQATGESRAITQDTQVVSVQVAIPRRGMVLVQASANFELVQSGGGIVRGMCSISSGPSLELVHVADVALVTTPNFPVQVVPFARARAFDVAPGTFTANLVCSHFLQGSATVTRPSLTAIFFPTP